MTVRWKHFLSVVVARNKEFLRDRATLAWNLLFPFMILIGFAVIFSRGGQTAYKVARLGGEPVAALEPFLDTEYLQFLEEEDSQEEVLGKLGRHQFDMVVDLSSLPARYWINSSSAKGYMLERVLWGAVGREKLERGTVDGREIRYVDWLLPGLLGMNVMFSCLFGVGFVIVRYRKNGVLRRLKATPLSALEFLTAQVVSRLLLVMAVTVVVFVAADLFLDFEMLGSYADLLLIFAVGAFSCIALGLLISSRTASEELAGGLLNLASMPMMLLSGVWFSLEGAPDWVKGVAGLLPLTHLTDAARQVMNEGAGLFEISWQLVILAVMSLAFLIAGSLLFRWE